MELTITKKEQTTDWLYDGSGPSAAQSEYHKYVIEGKAVYEFTEYDHHWLKYGLGRIDYIKTDIAKEVIYNDDDLDINQHQWDMNIKTMIDHRDIGQIIFEFILESIDTTDAIRTIY